MKRVCCTRKRSRWILVLTSFWLLPIDGVVAVGVENDAAGEPVSANVESAVPATTAGVALPQEEFQPLTSQQVEQGRAHLTTAARELERYLNQGSAENAAAWRRYLKWDALQEQIAADAEPDARVLGEILTQYYTGEPGLELPPFVAVRDALLGYRRQTLATADADVARLYQEQLAAIDNDLKAGAAQSGGPLADLTARLEWLEHLGQAPQLVAQVRQQFDHPNVMVSAAARTVATGFAEPVSELTEVNEMILKTHVCGTAQMQGTVTANLVPCDEMAIVELQLSGVANSQTVGHQSPVRIYSHGVTQVFARKRLLIDRLGVRGEPAIAHCSTDNRISSIRSESAFASNLITKMAWKRARATRTVGRAHFSATCGTTIGESHGRTISRPSRGRQHAFTRSIEATASAACNFPPLGPFLDDARTFADGRSPGKTQSVGGTVESTRSR